MRKSSIHIKPVKANSETHNNRLIEYDYVRNDLTHLNYNYQEQTIKERIKLVYERKKELTGRKLQKNATPIREAVVNLKSNHTSADVAKLCDEIKKEFGIRAFQIHIHKDEGHYDEKIWKPNPHAHIVFDWTDEESGKMIRLKKHDMSRMQSLVAHVLQMKRGQSSDRKHLDALQYKNEQEKKKLKKLRLQIEKIEKIIRLHKENGLKIDDLKVKKLFGLNKEKTLENFKDNLQAAFVELERKRSHLHELNQKNNTQKNKIEVLESEVHMLKKEMQKIIYKVPLKKIQEKRNELAKQIEEQKIQRMKNKERNKNRGRGLSR